MKHNFEMNIQVRNADDIHLHFESQGIEIERVFSDQKYVNIFLGGLIAMLPELSVDIQSTYEFSERFSSVRASRTDESKLKFELTYV